MTLTANPQYINSLEVSDTLECIEITYTNRPIENAKIQLSPEDAITLANMLIKCAMNHKEMKGNK